MSVFMMGFLSGIGVMVLISIVCAFVLVRLIMTSAVNEEEPVKYTVVSLNGHTGRKVH